MQITFDDKLEQHLDDVLAYWQKIYFEYEQRAARIATAGGVLATFFGSLTVKFSMAPTSITSLAVVIAYSGVVLIVGSSLFSLTIFLPITHRGKIGLLALRRAEREENSANLEIRTVSREDFPGIVHRRAQVFFWAPADESDTTVSYRLRSKLAAISQFRRMSSLRSMRNLVAVWLLIFGTLVILVAGAVQLSS